MDPVEDDLDDDVRARQGGPGDPRVAVAEGAHRVEEVRDGPNPGVEGGVRLLRGRVRVSERDGDAASEQEVDEGVGPRKLRREGHHPDPTRVEQPLEQGRVGVSARQGRMRAEALRGEKRSFDVDTEDARPAVRVCRDLVSAAWSCSSGAVIEGREVGGDSGLEQRLSRSLVAVAVRVQEVHSTEAVDLDVDETRRCDSTPVAT